MWLRICLALLATSPAAAASPASMGPSMAISAEDPLAAARTALHESRFDDAARLAPSAPGLMGRALEGKGDDKGACALYEKGRAPSLSSAPAATLRAARCRSRAGDAPGALAAYLEAGASPLGKDPGVVDEIAAFADNHELPLPASVVAVVGLTVGAFDVDAREHLANALAVIARRATGDAAANARRRLTDELFDTAAGRALGAPPPADLAHALPRARALDETHESDAVIALLTPLVPAAAAKGAVSSAECEARLLMGRAERKLRHYSAAKKHLDFVVQRCTDDTKKRAAYLATKVAVMGKSAGALAQTKTFAQSWPKDGLTDDVLFWQGELYEAQKQDVDARKSWQKILDDHPSGDMRHEARFRMALSYARTHEAGSAARVLDDAARAADDRVDVLDRALYWRARLTALPRLDALTPTDDAAARADGTRGLVALAASRPASFYGHLARLLVTTVLAKGDASVTAALAVPGNVRALAAHASVSPSAACGADPRFVLARALLDAGYDDEGLILLSDLDPGADRPEDLVVTALLLARAGAPGSGHALLRSKGRALLAGRPGDDTALAWSVDWPRAYEGAIVPAATSHGVPPALLFGVSREESAFDADVISWAGAVGLCQLMPPTASDEAKSEGLPVPDINDLRDPVLNARLGASHIGRRLKGMRHPLQAIAAYNAGPGAVAQWSPPGPLDQWVEQIPVEETRNYVKKVTGSWVTYSMLDGSVDDVAFDLVIR